jgi:hypothetical protein
LKEACRRKPRGAVEEPHPPRPHASPERRLRRLARGRSPQIGRPLAMAWPRPSSDSRTASRTPPGRGRLERHDEQVVGLPGEGLSCVRGFEGAASVGEGHGHHRGPSGVVQRQPGEWAGTDSG